MIVGFVQGGISSNGQLRIVQTESAAAVCMARLPSRNLPWISGVGFRAQLPSNTKSDLGQLGLKSLRQGHTIIGTSCCLLP